MTKTRLNSVTPEGSAGGWSTGKVWNSTVSQGI